MLLSETVVSVNPKAVPVSSDGRRCSAVPRSLGLLLQPLIHLVAVASQVLFIRSHNIVLTPLWTLDWWNCIISARAETASVVICSLIIN